MAGADEDVEDNEGNNYDNGIEGDRERLVHGFKLKHAVAGDEEQDGDEGKFGKAGHDSERKGFGVAIGDLGATIDEFGDNAWKPKFGGGATAVIEEPHDEGEGDEDADDGGEELHGKCAVEGVAYDEAGGGKKQEDNGADTGNETANEVAGFAGDVFAGGFVIEQKQTAQPQLE